MSVSISICIVIAPAVFFFLYPSVLVVIAFVAFSAIVVGIRQDGENQGRCAGEGLAYAIVKFKIFHPH